MPKPRGSCDACRKAKLGCDATLGSGTPCFNCVRRGKECSVASSTNSEPRQQPNSSQRRDETINLLCDSVPQSVDDIYERRRLEALSERSTRRASPSVPSGTNDALPRRAQAVSLHLLLWDIFQRIYESRLGLFSGSSCCPYVGSLDVRVRIPLQQLLTV